MIRRPPRSTQSRSSAASDVYKRQLFGSSPCAEHAVRFQSDVDDVLVLRNAAYREPARRTARGARMADARVAANRAEDLLGEARDVGRIDVAGYDERRVIGLISGVVGAPQVTDTGSHHVTRRAYGTMRERRNSVGRVPDGILEGVDVARC